MGIPVLNNNKHVIYVWLDALTNYISALNFPDTNDEKFKKFWPADVHIIGKDILRSRYILGQHFYLQQSYHYLKEYSATVGYYLMKKMSKSLGNILDPIEIINKSSTN